jgi:hypothetical protein
MNSDLQDLIKVDENKSKELRENGPERLPGWTP